MAEKRQFLKIWERFPLFIYTKKDFLEYYFRNGDRCQQAVEKFQNAAIKDRLFVQEKLISLVRCLNGQVFCEWDELLNFLSSVGFDMFILENGHLFLITKQEASSFFFRSNSDNIKIAKLLYNKES